MYMAYVLPLLEYCDSVWDNCPTETKRQLDVIHIEAARIITGATKLCSVSKLLTDLGWVTLQNRRKKHRLIILFKILHGLTPVYLNDLLPPLVQDTTSYNLRNSNHFQNYRANTNLFLNSFFPATIRAWNDLPAEVKDAPSAAAFKSRLNKDLLHVNTHEISFVLSFFLSFCSFSHSLNVLHCLPFKNDVTYAVYSQEMTQISTSAYRQIL